MRVRLDSGVILESYDDFVVNSWRKCGYEEVKDAKEDEPKTETKRRRKS